MTKYTELPKLVKCENLKKKTIKTGSYVDELKINIFVSQWRRNLDDWYYPTMTGIPLFCPIAIFIRQQF